jgi:RimJ/RimL family protein N-acetyltransferase
VVEARNHLAAETLSDGTPVTIRAIRPDDGAGILAAFKSLARESVFTRFFTYKKSLTDAELRQVTDVDFDHVVALVVTTKAGDGEKVIGGGRYFSEGAGREPRNAELAFITADDYRGRGIARLLLKHLLRIARQQGVRQFEADVLAQNLAMLAVFRRSGLAMTHRLENNVVHVTLSLEADPSSAL